MQRRLSRRAFLKEATRLTIRASVFGLGSAWYGYNVEPSWVEVTRLTLTLRRLASNFDGYRIAQISDLHAGGWTTRRHLQDIVATVNAKAADLIVITGDFFSRDPDFFAGDIIDTVSKLSAPDGVACTLGNHDHWAGADTVRAVIAATRLIELNNTAFTIERDRSLLTIAGVDDIWERQNRLDHALNKVPGEGAAILLAHEPDFADEVAATGRFDMQISGHSHGGQVVFPFVGPPQLPYLGRKYHAGLYQVRDMVQYTNRGIGMIRPYVRFNCRPEITLFTLFSQARP